MIQPMKKILVPCDFSPASKKVYQSALEIASATGGHVTVMHSIKPVSFYLKILDRYLTDVAPPSSSQKISLAAQTRFEKFSHNIDTNNVPVRFLIKYGTLYQTLLKEVTAQHADLVIMGTRGADGLKELLLGSNTEKMIRASPVPVLVVHEFKPISKVKNIVFPVTLEPTDEILPGKVKALQLFFNAKLHILYVKTPSEPASEQQIRKRLQAYVSFNGLENFTVHIRSAENETEAILSFSAGLADSMIAMGTRAQKGLSHLVLGSITEDVANHAVRNVWTYGLNVQTEKHKLSQPKASSVGLPPRITN